VEISLNKVHYVSIFLLIAVVMTAFQTAAASTTIASLDPEIVTPTPAPTPSITIPNMQLDINTLFKTLITQELSSVDRVILTTELERFLDDLAAGQYQISAEFEDDGENTETKKTLTITISPIGVPETPTEDEESIAEEPEEDNGGDDDGGDDDGGDD
jgi:hypothetical protein